MRRFVVALLACLLGVMAMPAVASASPGSPFGSFDVLSATPQGFHLIGWAQDPDSSAVVTVHAYVDGVFARSVQTQWQYPGTIGLRGFQIDVPATPGPHTVCAYALSIGPGDPTQLGCRSGFRNVNPHGTVDAIQITGGGPVLQGWAIDGDTYDPIQVRVYVDGRFAGQGNADRFSPDVVNATGWPGNHRYEIPLALSPGPHQVCAYGINFGPGANALLACRVMDHSVDPFGALELASANNVTGRVNVHGWAIDPDTGGPITVHFWAGSSPVASLVASRNRADIGRAFQFGAAHGFADAIPVPASASTLCAYGINVGAGGANHLLGCLPINRSGNPFGALRRSITSCGFAANPFDVWAIDPDTAGPIQIDVYQLTGSAGLIYETSFTSDDPSPDPGFVGLFPQFGPNHWGHSCSIFSTRFYYAINAPGTRGTNQFIGADPFALLH